MICNNGCVFWYGYINCYSFAFKPIKCAFRNEAGVGVKNPLAIAIEALDFGPRNSWEKWDYCGSFRILSNKSAETAESIGHIGQIEENI